MTSKLHEYLLFNVLSFTMDDILFVVYLNLFSILRNFIPSKYLYTFNLPFSIVFFHFMVLFVERKGFYTYTL